MKSASKKTRKPRTGQARKKKLPQGNIRDINQRKEEVSPLRDTKKNLPERERRLENLFENSPIPLWEEDFSEVKNYLKNLKLMGKSADAVRKHIQRRPEIIGQCVEKVRVIGVNRACLALHKAGNKASLLAGLGALVTEESREALQSQIVAIATGQTEIELDSMVRTLDGQPRHVHLHWSVAPGYEETLERVIVSTEDISERRKMEETLNASERRFRSLIENSHDAIALLDSRGRLLYESPSGLRITGYTLEERVGGSGLDLLHPDDLEKVRRLLGQVVQQPQASVNAQVRSRRKDGEWRWLDVSAVNLLEDPAVGAIVVNYRDITGSRQAEAALAEALQTQNLLLESVGEGIHGLDTEGQIMFENAASLHMFGWEAREMLGKNAHALIHHHRADGSLYPSDECPIYRILRDGETRRAENEAFFRKDGTSFPVEYTCAAMRDKDGAITGVVVSFQDVTERKQAEDALKQSEEKFFKAFHSSPDAILITRMADGRITEVNEGFCRITEYSKDEAVGRTTMELGLWLDAADREYFISLMQKDGRVREQEFKYRVKSGRAIDALLSAEMVSIGGERYLLGIVRDVTERKRADENIRRERVFSDSIINSLPGIFYLFDEQGRFLRWNDNFEKVSGYSAKEVAHMRPLDFFEGAEKELIQQRIGRVFTNGTSDAEADFVSKDGARTPFYFTGLRIQLNGINCVIGVGVDITERRRAEKLLRDLSLAVNASGDVLFMTGKDGIITSVNSQFTDLYGYTPEEVVGKTTPRILKSGKQTPEVYERFWQTILRGELFRGEVINKTKDGRLISIEETVSPFFDDRGNLAGFLAIQRNVSARKHAEEALQRSEARLSEAQRIAHLGNWEWDIATNTIWWSDETYRIFGLRPEQFEATVQGFLKTIHPDDHGLVTESINKALYEQAPYNIDHRILLPDGAEKVVHEQAVVESDESGRSLRMAGITLDITARKQAEENIQKQLGRLKALREIDMAITSGFDMPASLATLLRHVTEELGADAADILLFNPNLNLLEFAAGHGFRTRSIEKSSLQLEEGFAGQAAFRRSLMRVTDLNADAEQYIRARLLAGEGFACYFGMPLIAKGVVKGVLEVFHRSPLDPDQEWLDFLQTLAGQAAIAIEDAQLFNNLKQSNLELLHAYDATIEGWSRALDLRDKETEGHTQRVTEMAIRLAQKFGLSDEELKYIRWGGLLHDIGKMGVPDAILFKSDALTPEEWDTMKQHPAFALQMLSPIRYLKPALDIPYYHHEHWDGSGYPVGLKGKQIPLAARIFAVADVWDALTSDRPYRDQWNRDKAMEYIRSHAGSYFDPRVVEIFQRMVEDEFLDKPPADNAQGDSHFAA